VLPAACPASAICSYSVQEIEDVPVPQHSAGRRESDHQRRLRVVLSRSPIHRPDAQVRGREPMQKKYSWKTARL
jgi:hypothetical protein